MWDFICEGHFGTLTLGMTREEVARGFALPEAWGGSGDSFANAAIWCFGNFEVYFDDDGLVWMIFNDYFDDGIDGGKCFQLDSWIFSERELSLERYLQELNRRQLSYQVEAETRWNPPQVDILMLQSGVKLSFRGEEDFPPFTQDPNTYILGNLEKTSLTSQHAGDILESGQQGLRD